MVVSVGPELPVKAHRPGFYGHAEHNISGATDAIERTPIASKADTLAALDLIRDESIDAPHHLVIAMVAALRG